MKMIARTLEEPAVDECGLMSGVIIEDQMHLEISWDGMIEKVEKLAEFLTAVFGKALADDFAGGDVQGGKKGGGAVAEIIGGASFELAGAQRQNRLGTAQRLDLALFIHAQHQRVDRWAQIQPHDVADLLDQLRVFGQDEALLAMRLEAKSSPDATDAGLAEVELFGQKPSAPMSGAFGTTLQGLGDDFLDALIVNLPWGTHPRFVEKTVQPAR